MNQLRGVAWRPHRIALASLITLIFLMLGTGSADADAAAPTNYKSTVFGVDPNTASVEFVIVGGDAFIEIAVVPGHTAEVPGYFSEPYIRIDSDGSVWVNHDSPAFYINQDRYGNVQTPPDADGQGEPQWERVGDNGRHAWQDHRIHWMSLDLPPTVAGDRYQVVFPWDVPVVIDGEEGSVRGELVWVPSRSPLGPLLAGMLGLLPLVFWDRIGPRLAAVIIAVAGAVAVVIVAAQYVGSPVSARSVPLSFVLPLLAMVAAALAGFRSEGHRGEAQVVLLAAGIGLLLWGLLSAAIMWLPILPSEALPNLQRAGVAMVIWVGIGVTSVAALRLIRRGNSGSSLPIG